MVIPMYDDADVVLRLSQIAATLGLSGAINWMWSDQFIVDHAEFVEKYPAGSEEYRQINSICSWYETVGTLYKHGLINEDLLFDWLWVAGVWNRLQGFALGLREQAGVAAIYENFEAMAKAQAG